MNCLTYALEMWYKMPHLRILYNGDHVIAIEPGYIIQQIDETPEYLSLYEFGLQHLMKSFRLSPKYKYLLTQYFEK